MTVEHLIYYLNQIEDKKQNVYMTSFDFQRQTDIESAVEIKSASCPNMFMKGICLLGDL